MSEQRSVEVLLNADLYSTILSKLELQGTVAAAAVCFIWVFVKVNVQ